jgi:hypothetical protein
VDNVGDKSMTKKINIDVKQATKLKETRAMIRELSTQKDTSEYVNRLLTQEDDVQPITDTNRKKALEINAKFFANNINKKFNKKVLRCV